MRKAGRKERENERPWRNQPSLRSSFLPPFLIQIGPSSSCPTSPPRSRRGLNEESRKEGKRTRDRGGPAFASLFLPSSIPHSNRPFLLMSHVPSSIASGIE